MGCALGGAAAAQDDAGRGAEGQGAEDQIVVEGQRPDALETLREVRALSQDVDGNLARFETPVCPGVAGMPGRLAVAIVGRMRADIDAIGGVEPAPEDCDPNLTMIVTEDGGALVDGLARKAPTMFGYMTSSQITGLRRSEGPAWVWQTSQPKRADGGPVQMISEISYGPGQPPHHISTKGAYAVSNASLSRLSSSVRRDTGLAFVVLSRAAIEGKSVTQLADYSVLRGLAGTRPGSGDAAGTQSIAALFAVPSPEEWTEFDRAYLTSLYSGTNGLTYRQKTREIAQDVAKELGR